MNRVFIFFALCLCLHARAFHVVIDPGHGGNDVGTSRDSFFESEIVFQIAEKVKSQVEKNHEIKATLTRTSNKGLSLSQRVDLANKLHADLFLSLHANSSDSVQVSGMEFYFSAPPKRKKPTTLKDSSSNAIVERIKNELEEFGKVKSSLEFSKNIQQITTDQKSVIRRAPFYVIENTNMPSVLVEVGFISNRREARKLASPAYQEEIAKLLTAAILKYKIEFEKSNNEKTLL
jgi:N-acetylmuramoyl-L-alanine amidase